MLDRALDEQLKSVFPAAITFSAKQENPLPHFVAYTGTPGSPTIAGYVLWTTELQPLERGYDGPIKILVGLDTNARITGVLVTVRLFTPLDKEKVLPHFYPVKGSVWGEVANYWRTN